MQQSQADPKCENSFGRLIRSVYRHGRMYLHQCIHSLGIGPPQFFILHTLFHHPGITQEEIGRRIGGDPSTLARTILRLEKAGYVRRERDPRNRRAYRVNVTPDGEALRDRLESLLAAYSDVLTRGFSADEKRTALEYLRRMERNVMTALKETAHGQEKP